MTTTFFNFGNGPVPAHQHPNGGGWVADSALDAANAAQKAEFLRVVGGEP
jgi:hypothetical protein